MIPLNWLLIISGVLFAISVAGMFINSRVPKITMTVGFDPRFTHGDYGIWVPAAPDRAKAVEDTMRRHGAVEVRHER